MTPIDGIPNMIHDIILDFDNYKEKVFGKKNV
jgi:hypothetical protein